MASVDLHFHSTCSDGALSAQDVIQRAVQRQATLLALTDHDCTAGLAEARAMAQAMGVGFLNGVEISVTWKGQHTIHIVGLGIDPEHPVMVAGLQSIRKHRIDRAQQMAEQLANNGIYGALEGAVALCNNIEMIGRMHFARFLVNAGYVKDVRAVFRQFLTPGKPGYVEHTWATLTDAVAWIRTAGGAAIIAHPGRYRLSSNALDQLVQDFKVAGGEAIEVVSGSHSADDMHKCALLAQRYALWSSVGSDFHAPDEGRGEVGYTTDLPLTCYPILDKLENHII